MHRAQRHLPQPELSTVPSRTLLRPQRADDAALVVQLLLAVRPELAVLGEPEVARQSALREQVWEQQHGVGGRRVLEVDGEPVGRVWTARSEVDVLLVDLALLPCATGRGRGTAVLRTVLREAAAQGRGVVLHVDRTATGAARLYERLGFREVGRDALRRALRHPPP